jgi:hypothetical protein
MNPFLIVLYQMIMLAPLRGDADTLLRSQLANAIVEGTDDAREQTILARLAYFEGSYSRHVASCAVKGDNGRSLGLFQVQPRSTEDKREACGTLAAQVRVALRFIRRSVEVCSGNVGSAVLNLYVSGDCTRGHAASALRWGAP